MKAKLISFEGIDGIGKTTQISLLAEALKFEGKRVNVVKLPRYEYFWGNIIFRMLKSGSAVQYPNVFQIFQWLDKLLFQVFYLPRLLRENDYLLLDRWHVSMWAYGIPGGASKLLTTMCINTLKSPDLTLIFCGNSKREQKNDSYEIDSFYQKSVALNYILWSILYESIVINADESIEQITESVINHVNSL